MRQLLDTLIAKAKTDKVILLELKNIAANAQMYEFACYLRELETTNFPETDEIKNEKARACQVSKILEMVGFKNVDNDAAWLIDKTMKKFAEKDVNFSADDDQQLIFQQKQLFA